MIRPQRAALERLYRAACYEVPLGTQTLRLRIGHRQPQADHCLNLHAGVQHHWVILTACNPGSTRLTPAENQQRTRDLHAALGAHGDCWCPAINRDPNGTWPDEPAVLIADPDPVWIGALAERWEQAAYVSGRLGGAPRLVWCT